MADTTTTTTTTNPSIDLSSMVGPFFGQMGLTVDNLVVTSSYDEYSNVNVLNISSDALSFGAFQVVPSMNITATFDANNFLVDISGLADIANHSFGMVTEDFLAKSVN